MTTAMHEAFLADIIASPADDTARLIYADWLQDHGEEDRAEFIRVQCEYSRLHPHYAGHEEDDGCEICSRATVLSGLLSTRFRISRNEHPPWAKDCPSIIMQTKPTGPPVEWQWRRGFVSFVKCPWPAWEQHGPDLVARHPVERVALSSPVPYRVQPDDVGLIGLERGTLGPLWEYLVGGVSIGTTHYHWWTEKEYQESMSWSCIYWATEERARRLSAAAHCPRCLGRGRRLDEAGSLDDCVTCAGTGKAVAG